MDTRATPAGPLAAVDIGSNSIRLEIGEFVDGRYCSLAYHKESVRLGAGLDDAGWLSEDAMQRALACLERFASRLADWAVKQARAVGTQTLREARNRDAFLRRAGQTLRLPIDIVSGREEARLTHVGVNHLQPAGAADGVRLVIDIGGRSTELILGRGASVAAAESFPVGCVGLSLRHFPGGVVTADGFRSAQIAAAAALAPALSAFGTGRWSRVVGSSGTAGAVSQTLLAAGITDGRITPQALRWCIQHCVVAGHVDRITLPALEPERRAVLPGGLAILSTLASGFDIGTLWPVDGALRHGVIVDLHARLQAQRHRSPVNVCDHPVGAL